MRAAPLVAATIAALLGSAQPQRGGPSSVTVDLLDDRSEVTRTINSALLLRLRNGGSRNEHPGWDVEVLHRPVAIDSRNLIHYAPHGPDLSDVDAWHVAEKFFPNERVVDVKGYPITVKIQLIEPRVSGKGADAQFVSGWLRVSWERRP